MACAGFTAWTTPVVTFVLDVPGALKATTDVVLSIVQGATRLDLHADALDIDADAGTITAELTQAQTGAFKGDRPADVQANIYYEDGTRVPSEIIHLAVLANLFEEEMA